MSAERPNIILIDDDTSVRRALGRVMDSAGFAWESYESADQFLASADLEKATCIVADMSMPGMNGIDLKAHLNSIHSDIPLIYLTALDTSETRAAARDAGAAGYFRKPVDTQALLDAINWALHIPAET